MNTDNTQTPGSPAHTPFNAETKIKRETVLLANNRDRTSLTMALVTLVSVGVGFGFATLVQQVGHSSCDRDTKRAATLTKAQTTHVFIQDERADRERLPHQHRHSAQSRITHDHDGLGMHTHEGHHHKSQRGHKHHTKRKDCRSKRGHKHHRLRLGVVVDDNEDGAKIRRLVSGMPAEKEGLRVGDVINNFDGHEITTANQLVRIVKQTPRGKKVVIIIIRDGEPQTVEVTLAR